MRLVSGAKCLGVFGAVFIAFTQGAYAQLSPSMTANVILPGCRQFITDRSTQNLFNQGMCAGIVFSLSALPDKMLGYCVPDNTTVEQSVRVVIVYVERHPARMHEAFNILAADALREAWHCK